MHKPPNIILIMTDQQRGDSVGALGSPWMQTPTLDHLAAEGAAFTNCFCAAPSCVPSRASFFNGRYPSQLGVYRNADAWSDSWVRLLREAGYHTVNVGKMHTVPFDAQCGFDERYVVENKDRPLRLERDHGGFLDEWDRFLLNNGQVKPSREWYRAHDPDWGGALGAYAWPLEERYHPDVFVGEMARWFIRTRRAGSPLFLQIGFPGPHPPYDPPEDWLHRYQTVEIPLPDVSEGELRAQPAAQRRFRQEMVSGNHDAVKWLDRPTPTQLLRLRRHYAANISLIDAQIAGILAALSGRGWLDDAVVVFTSDHGDNLGDHGHIQKWTMYDSVVRVPSLVRAPGRMPPGRRLDGLIQQFDLAATLLDWAGVPAPDGWAARSAQGLADGSWTGREHVFAEHSSDNILKGVSFVSMIRDRTRKLVHYLDQDEGEFYDLTADPGETQNRWGDPACAGAQCELLDVLRDWRIRNTLPA